ncbi:MAG: aminoacyl-tRNA deacylase [Myxococcota bacterium]
MISNRIVDYLKRNKVPFTRRWHPRAITAQEVAASIHVTGYRVAKSIIVEADGQKRITVLPAAERIDERRLAEALGAKQVRLCTEAEFAELFPDCELGAEPPFGALYGLPVIVDGTLASDEAVVFRAGSHEETIEMRYDDFERLERPKVASFIAEKVPLAAEYELEAHPAI